jgi:small subunit ribosomal protein S2
VMSKKEVSRLEKERLRLTKTLSGIKGLTDMPGCLFVIDPVQENTAILEARRMEVPVVAVCDTNCDPDLIDYPVPGNDDAIRSVKLFCSLMADAILEGKAEAEKAATPSTSTAPVVEQVVAEAPIVLSEPVPQPVSPTSH